MATAPKDGRVNLTGSGNETAAHVLENGRMTLMWCAFKGKPLILRAYGTASASHPGEAGYEELASHLPNWPGARQIFDLRVNSVQTSCGYAVPFLDDVGDRTRLVDSAEKKVRKRPVSTNS